MYTSRYVYLKRKSTDDLNWFIITSKGSRKFILRTRYLFKVADRENPSVACYISSPLNSLWLFPHFNHSTSLTTPFPFYLSGLSDLLFLSCLFIEEGRGLYREMKGGMGDQKYMRTARREKYTAPLSFCYGRVGAGYSKKGGAWDITRNGNAWGKRRCSRGRTSLDFGEKWEREREWEELAVRFSGRGGVGERERERGSH